MKFFFRFLTLLILVLSGRAEAGSLSESDFENLGRSIGAIGDTKAFCSAFLVHPQILIGISHCNHNMIVRTVRFKTGTEQSSYKIRRIFEIGQDGVALYYIDKPVLDRPLLKLSRLAQGIQFPMIAMGYPSNWPNENGVKIPLPESDLGLRASWSKGHSVTELKDGISKACKGHKLTLANGSPVHTNATILVADQPYVSGSGMSGAPVFDRTGAVVGIHTCEGGGFYSSQEALETLTTMKEALGQGLSPQRVITVPGKGRGYPAMRLAMDGSLGVYYAPDYLTADLLDFILSNAD
ncbi:MAG: trypsin-like peptidase domain-containing protein [Bdellovibrionaceae bacterium]|nr:trypsin-like peptidase domain-containing protein [Pseudobdellovibrionaceae bacterium]